MQSNLCNKYLIEHFWFIINYKAQSYVLSVLQFSKNIVANKVVN